jgi:hypothetical protein
MNVPVSAPMIGFAIGCFEQLNITAEDVAAANEEDATARGTRGHPEIPVMAYCPIGRTSQMQYSCRYLTNVS